MRISSLFTLLLILLSNSGRAQLSLSNILEYQLGNLPETEPKNLSTLYDQLNLAYHYNDIEVSARFEQFHTADRAKSYTEVAQRHLSYSHSDLEITVGNYYKIIGRGLLLRSYEIPGAIVESRGFRTRYGFYRDIDGILVKFEPDVFEVNAYYGRPLNSEMPPSSLEEFRRPNLVQGIESNFYLGDWNFGGSYLRNNTESEINEYGSLTLGANLPLNMQIYSEYAQQFGGENKILDISDKTAHALYLSMNLSYGLAGISAEYKDYNDFMLGFNDPPPLVKEHQYLLLNRSTHIVEPINETGWQTEIYYTFEKGHGIVLNMAEAINDVFSSRFLFQEQFLELTYHLNRQLNIKGFVDRSEEAIFAIKDRHTYGVYLEKEWPNGLGTLLDLEYQTFIRDFEEKQNVKNQAIILTISYAPNFALGIVAERSNDSEELRENESIRYWIGGNFSYQYSQVHLISLFYGKRRGGRACTAGICYEILPFEGFEVRITSIL